MVVCVSHILDGGLAFYLFVWVVVFLIQVCCDCCFHTLIFFNSVASQNVSRANKGYAFSLVTFFFPLQN